MDPIDEGAAAASGATGASPTPVRNKRSWLMTAAVATGLAVGAAGLAGAATSGSSGSSSTTAPSTASGYGPAPSGQPPSGQAPSGAPDPATMANGPGETLLTADAATQAKAAALAAVPGATVIRVETDSSGAGTYEAHLKKSDGTEVTVLMDASFKVTSTVDGFGGPGPQGSRGPGRPGDSSSNGSSSSSESTSGTTN
jgi:hypothetical protein